ncbi:quinone oxidoreductase [Bradyrhizobium diazoefficiens]|uniref:quinone oxidoreductase family protein n=1 Tax=Bradyrhizobium diazoefficiens TaxID=1355477 RepID=UPI00190C1689|nr:quinone oxidoreductase [Bradyrhizobium diazoefficiens]QQO16784.1 quinone oxidoreductase [Bradyrhizobium diazoefficiens]
MKTRAIRVHEAGGPEVLKTDEIELKEPGEGEAIVRHTAIGVNLIDIYHRTATAGQYALPRPATLGVEAAGVVEAIGAGVDNVTVGDRVAYWMLPGAYSAKRVAPAWRLVKIPDGVSDQAAAAVMLKGGTAFYLLHDIWKVKKGDNVLVHTAAGGVGRLMSQWAKHLGATVIGTVGSAEKVKAAQAAGCAHVVVLKDQDFEAEARKITGGAGVDVVYDSIGADTFDKSLGSIRPLGMLVSVGQASGPVPPLDISKLAQKGSIFLSKPTLATFVAKREGIVRLAEGVFAGLKEGAITAEIGMTAPLAEVADVHRAFEGRKTTGSIVLIP